MNDTPKSSAVRGWSFGSVLILAGILTVWLAQDIPRSGVGSAEDPGPRAFPVGLGICLIAGGCFELGACALRRRRARAHPRAALDPGAAAAGQGAWLAARESLEVLVVLGATVLYVVAVPWLGFGLSTTLFAAGVMRWLGCRWRLAAVVSLALALSVYLLFGVLFKVQLPPGRLGLPF